MPEERPVANGRRVRRKELTAHSLLAYARPVYQLLSLPEAPAAAAAPSAEPAMATAVQAPGAAGHPNNSPEPRPAQPPPAERFGETLSASQILRRMLEGGAQ